jgi:hypothetical protein
MRYYIIYYKNKINKFFTQINLLERITFFSLKNITSKEQPKHLGRWNIDYCHKKIDNKIDLSNEDHCGPCGQYVLSKKSDK